MQRLGLIVAFGAAVSLGGCADPDTPLPPAETSHLFETSEVDGVVVATNSGGPRYAGELFRYEKLVELNTDDGNPDSVLHQALAFTMDDEGVFYVADPRRHRVAVFDPQGNYERSMGQEGDGPGDLRNPFDIDLIDGTLHVIGYRGHRVTVFARDGTPLDVINHNQGNRPRAMHRTGDGRRVVITSPFERRNELELQGYRARADVVDDRGESLAHVESEWVASAKMVTHEVNGRDLRFISPIHYVAFPQALFRRGADPEILLADGSEPLLRWYDLNGQLRRRVHLGLEPETADDASRRAIADALERQIIDAPENSNEAERVLGKLELGIRLDNMVVQEPKAFWGQATLDDRNVVWLRYAHPVRQDYYANQEYRFRLVNAAGEYLGDTTWPAALEGKVVRGHLLAMVFDAESLQVVPTVFRMTPTKPALTY